MNSYRFICLLALFFTFGLAGPTLAVDWPTWGFDNNRNMRSPETGLPSEFEPGKAKPGTEEIDMATTKNVKWVAKLGSQSYGNAAVVDGRIVLGTNNATPRDPRIKGDRGVVMCLREDNGAFVWQLAIPKLGAGKVSDWEYLGICSAPTIDQNRVYLMSSRCELLCLDLAGMANGNDGAFQDEATYLTAGKGRIEPSPQDGDIIWRYDLRDELGIFPHNITSSSPMVHGNQVIFCTSNGVDWSHTNIPAPNAPILASVDKHTGELLAEEADGISMQALHGNWSSPGYAKIDGQEMIILGGPDGVCYAFDTKPIIDDEGYSVFRQLWKHDCNPPQYRHKDGKPIRYIEPKGPSEIISTPVTVGHHVYVAIGQDPEHGEGVGNLVCIDARVKVTKREVWAHPIKRSISTVAVADGLLFIADFSGFVYCFDAKTGALHWQHQTGSHIWASPLVADGKVYLGNEDGDLYVFAARKEKKILNNVNFKAPIYASPIAANGVLYVQTQTHLYALAKVKKP